MRVKIRCWNSSLRHRPEDLVLEFFTVGAPSTVCLRRCGDSEAFLLLCKS